MILGAIFSLVSASAIYYLSIKEELNEKGKNQ